MNLRNLTAKGQWTLSDNSLLRRILVCFVGQVITACGIAICLEGKSGVDPFTAFLQGISHVSGISFAVIVPIVNIIMLILVFPFDRSIFGLGTVIMGFFVGPIVGFFNMRVSNRLVGISGDIFAASKPAAAGSSVRA